MPEQYDPSAMLNNPDTDFLEQKAAEAIKLHQADVAKRQQVAAEAAAEEASDQKYAGDIAEGDSGDEDDQKGADEAIDYEDTKKEPTISKIVQPRPLSEVE